MKKNNNLKRLFIAVDIPQVVIKEITRIQNFLKKEAVFKGTYVKPYDAHLTLKFLGDVKLSLIPKIQERLHKIKHKSMRAHLEKLGMFKKANTNQARAIFLSVICPELPVLVKQIDEALSDFFKHEERPFVTHLTIARVKSIADYDILKDLLDQFKLESISFEITSFVLKQSILSPEGPEYTDIERYN